MPADQQEQLRRLDQQLHDEDSQTRARLMGVLDDYAAWFTRLPEDDRRRISAANTVDEKLKTVREIRRQQWYGRLPLAVRDEWKAAPTEMKGEILDRWWKEERKQRDEWASARRSWDVFGGERPRGPIADFMVFADNRLVPMLSLQEKAKVRMAHEEARRTGNMAPFLRLVTDLAETHPILGLEPRFSTIPSLPQEYQTAIRSAGAMAIAAVTRAEGSWPHFPLAVTTFVRSDGNAMKVQLGPATGKDFPPATEEGIRKLQNKPMTPGDRDKLRKADGLWPDFPRVVHELAMKYKVSIPELTLPGDPQRWDRLRFGRSGVSAFPDPPEYLLRDFAFKLLKDPTGPRYSNPGDREELKRRFFDKNPDLLEKLRQQDRGSGNRSGNKP